MYKSETIVPIVSQRAKNRFCEDVTGDPQDNPSNLSRPRAWIGMNSSALSPTLMWPYPERRGVTMDCLYLEIEGQWCLVGSVDQGLVKRGLMDLLDRMTKKRTSRKKLVLQYFFFPHSEVTRSLSANNPPKQLLDFLSAKLLLYRLSNVIGLTTGVFLILIIYSSEHFFFLCLFFRLILRRMREKKRLSSAHFPRTFILVYTCMKIRRSVVSCTECEPCCHERNALRIVYYVSQTITRYDAVLLGTRCIL